MVRFLLIFAAIVASVVVVFLILVRMKVSQVTPVSQASKSVGQKLADVTGNFGAKEIPAEVPFTKAELLKVLEASISAVNKRIDAVAGKQQTQPVSLLQASSAPAAPTITTGPKSIYIPVGYGGSGTVSSDFGTITGQEVTINTADYPGYKQMVFEASFRIFQGNGTGEVRLFNKTDGTGVLNSTLSTTSQDYTTKTSSGFTLTGGSKTYVVQAKSSTGYSVDLQLTRIRVDF